MLVPFEPIIARRRCHMPLWAVVLITVVLTLLVDRVLLT